VERRRWHRLPLRVETNTDRILDLFARYEVRATFFVLGWIAERFPGLIRRVAEAGHEVASHGYDHVRIEEMDRVAFLEDVLRTRLLLEDLTGMAVKGYRAPSYSIGADTLWALPLLQTAGYRYSSSIYPVVHDHYGLPDAPRFPFVPREAPELLEIPITTAVIGKWRLPSGGGGYFRLFPYMLSRWALRRVLLEEGRPCVFYFHPWEIDTGQPRPGGLTLRTRFRHYINLDRTLRRVEALLKDFSWDRMDRIFLDGRTDERSRTGGSDGFKQAATGH